MAYAENYARGLGLSEVRLYTNEKLDNLVRYYQKLGFIETTRMQDGGYQRVFMSKSLVDN
jgi:GNAT superfamily N-acetyltransferase